MTFATTKRVIASTYHDVLKNQTVQAAAALSYYSILGVFPALIFMSAVMAYIPLPNFFEDVLIGMGRIVPSGIMPVINGVLNDILGKNSTTWLSLGTLGTIWVVSSAFDEMIEALDAAYDVTDSRPFWKTRLLAVGLAATAGVLLMCAIATMVIGPRVGHWLAGTLSLSTAFVLLWPVIHWTMALSFTVLAVAMIYFLAPNVKQRFRASLPGAFFSTACWIVLSYLLGIYFRYFENYNRTYGTLGGVLALMTWLYYAYFILLAGGELNAELAKERSSGQAAEQHKSANEPTVDHAA
ncbi:MAG: YihY/virulence factor BrkB family protein [Candidatus Sulfotelmatobacter sp.]